MELLRRPWAYTASMRSSWAEGWVSWQRGLVQNLTVLLCAETLMLGYPLEKKHPLHLWTRGPGGVET